MTPEEFYEQELGARKKAWDSGSYPALFEAVACCGMWQIPLPEWAVDPVLNAIKYVYDNKPVDGVGGGYTSHRGRTGIDYAHYLRWRAVKNQLEARRLTELPSSRGRPSKTNSKPTKASSFCRSGRDVAAHQQPKGILSRRA